MKMLQEIINPNTVSLTDTQQGVLITIKMAPTPEVAFETTNGSQQSVVARTALRTLGLIKVGGNKTILTQNGQHVIVNYNLVDETGQLTERGTGVLNNYNDKFNNDPEAGQAPEQITNQAPDTDEEGFG